MPSELIATICFACFLVFLFSGMPIAFSLLLFGIVGYGFINGWDIMARSVGLNIYMALHDYSLTVIPLFVLIGELVSRSGMGAQLLNTSAKWLSRLPGGMINAVIVANALFAAMSGSGIAASAIFAKIAVPNMVQAGYDKKLAAGSVAGAGPLAAMIPPSAAMVMYSILTDAPLGDMLIAGVIPGIMIATIMVLLVVIRCKFNPKLAPPVGGASWKDRFFSLRSILPVILVVISILGSIYAGISTPTEAAALGVLATVIICLAQKKLNWKGFSASLIDTIVTSGVISFILIAGRLFGSMIIVSGLPRLVSETFTAMGGLPILVVIMFIIMYIILGAFVDGMTMQVISLPIVIPVIIALGFDIVWFGILILCVIEIGGITPPFGVNLFATKGGLIGTAVEDIGIMDIAQGVLPFIIAILLALCLIIAFPAIPLFLPGLMQ